MSTAQSQTNHQQIPGIKHIIAVASAKGGVGKSTTAVNLALALAKQGANVGLLDADIYGPSQPQMLGGVKHPEVTDQQKLKPVIAHGLQTMSIGYLIEQSDTAMIWRGPMVTRALQQLIHDTVWENVDYLVIDMPPGTGDIQLTMAQKIPVTGAVVVTTPQEIALLDARKGITMFNKVKIPVLGVIENMSTHVCSQCGHQEHIFGKEGAKQLAENYQVDLLGALPLDISIREQTDSGNPTVVADPDSANSKTYGEIAQRLIKNVESIMKKTTSKFPKIVIDTD